MPMLTTLLLAILVLALCVAGTLAYGASRWQRGTLRLRSGLESARLPVMPAAYDERETDDLPPIVRRYFRAVLRDGQPIVSGVWLLQEGQIRVGGSVRNWRPFRATQMFTTRPPGFDWDARMRIGPGMAVSVHDSYAAGEGMLQAKALGLITLANVRGTPAAAQAELTRYLAEAAWFPTALLPSQGVRWEGTSENAARATLADGATTVSIEFRFDPEGLIASFWVESRYRGEIDGHPRFAPWHGRFWAYETRNGMRIPLEGEVAWQVSSGLSPYCRVRIEAIRHEGGARGKPGDELGT